MLTRVEVEVMKNIHKLVADTHHELNIAEKETRNRFMRDRENLQEAIRLIDCFLKDAEAV